MTRRRVLVRVALAALLVTALWLARDWLTTEKIVLHNDFFQYWSAAKYVLAGGNPYDHAAFIAFQKALGWEGDVPILTWNPPWALSLFLPFAPLRYAPALMGWLLLQGTIVIGAVVVLWRRLSPSRSGETGLVFLALLFPPTVLSLFFGQISGWLLVGVTLATIGVEDRRGFLVGIAVVLLSVKPHWTLLLMVGLGLWAILQAPWSTAAGALAGFGLTLTVPLAFRPGLLGDYLLTVTRQQPREFVSDTVGAGLRLLAGWEHFWVQFVPLLLGLTWLATELWRDRRRGPSAVDAVPLLALVSAFVAPYGWIFDNVVAIPALALVWTWLGGPENRGARRRFVAGFAVFAAALLALHIWLWHPMRWVHGWLTALLLAVYLAYRQRFVGSWVSGDLGLRPRRRRGLDAERPAGP